MSMDYSDIAYGVGAGVGAVYYVLACAVSVLCIIGLWKLFTKAGEHGWAAIIPFYNAFVLFKISMGSGAKMFLMLIPVYNIVVYIQMNIRLAKHFGKGGGYAAGLIFLPYLFTILLGFSKAEYLPEI